MSIRFDKEKKIAVDHFTPASQCLFLYFLYLARKNPVLKKDAASALGLTRTSITRASEQLKALGLITEAPHWKEIRMTACAEGKEFYDAGEPYLIDPVQKRIFSTLKYGNIIRHSLPQIKSLIRFRWQFL